MGPLGLARAQARQNFFFCFFFREFGLLPKNSGLNPMSFLFLVGGTLGPWSELAPSLLETFLRL